MADSIGTAYVQIEPSFEGVTGKIESQFSGEGQKAGSSFGSGFGSVVGTVGKAMAGAVAAAGTAVAGVTTQAVKSFAEFQQLEGGVETLFGNQYKSVEEYAKGIGVSLDEASQSWGQYQERQKTVMDNADAAYMTAGLSANEYMETVTSFAASLNASLGENAWQSANYADMAVTDMSDNANKMGSSMESIQNAYQGFAKGNFTMLDNLKLGYGGTKTEMERLMRDAEKLEGYELGSLNVDNFADVIDAIHIVQENLGITGTTAKEASETISGSFAMMKSSWENVLTAIGTGDSNKITEAINNLVASVGTLGENILPVVKQALQGISQLITQLAPEIAAALPQLITEILPGLLEAGVDIIKAIGEGLVQAIPDLMPAVTDVILKLCDMLIQMAPDLIKVGLEIIVQLALGIAQALPELIPTIVQTILTIVEYLIDNVDLLVDASIAIILGLADGLIEALPKLIEKAPEIIMKLVEALIRNAPKLFEAATALVFKLIEGIFKLVGELIKTGIKIVEDIKDGFSQKVEDAKNWGMDLINNFINGLKEKWEHLKQTVGQIAESIAEYLGFSEPEEGPLSNFHTYAPDMMELYAKGIRDNAGTVEDALNDATAGMMSTKLDVETARNVQMSVNPTAASADGGKLKQIETLLYEIIEKLQIPIVMDTGALVGATAGAYNNALGQIAIRGGRR